MSNINSLAGRIDAEFSAVEKKIKQLQTEKLEEHRERQKRLEELGKLFEELGSLWRPRLELLVKKFGDLVKTTPRIVPSTREVTFDFQSHLAHIRLRFSATTDRDIQKIILAYDLEIIPVLIHFNPHYEIAFALQSVDKEAAARWIDDRIVEFVQTYFSLGENDLYMRDRMVEDPIAQIRFPRDAAASVLEWGGQKFYFISEETRRDFEKQQGIGSK